MVDFGFDLNVMVGDEVVFIGIQEDEILIVDDMVEFFGIISYEIICVIFKCVDWYWVGQ